MGYKLTAHGRNDAPNGIKEESAIGDPPEVKLAKAKLLLMFQDLAGICKGSNGIDKQSLTNQAFRWFFGRSGDFEAWCETAGYLPEVVRKRAQHVYENGLPRKREKKPELAERLKVRKID